MTTIGHPRIALCCENPDTQRAWKSALCHAGWDLIDWPSALEDLDPSELVAALAASGIEIVCTDVASLGACLQQSNARSNTPAFGVVEIGSLEHVTTRDRPEFEYQPGNLTLLQLPADVDPAILRLVCQMLADAVRLRREIQQAGETHQNLVRQALIDPITELPNRRAWDEALALRMSAAEAGNSNLALAIFDLDYFKQINDEQGHAAGDATLWTVAQRLRTALREHDFVARLGGDEFGVLLSGVDRETAERIVERVRDSLGAPFANQGRARVTASAGVALRITPSRLSAQQLSQSADRALLAAKRAGRARTVVADES